MSQQLSWTTVQKRVNDLVPQEVNPRKITDKQMSDLKRSLKKFNLAEIPAVDLDGKILGGHQRVKALKLLDRGKETIDVRVPNRKLTEQEVKEYMIGSNKLGGDWDFELLKSFDFETLEFAGFDPIEISKFFDPNVDTKDDDFNVEKEIKQIKEIQTQTGDLIIMGNHKLLCASCNDKNAVEKLFNGEKASVIYPDPPFNINLSYNKGVGGSKSKKNYGGTIDDDKSPEEYKEFIRVGMKNALSVATDDVHVAYWCDEAWVWVFQTLYMELGVKNRRLNIWIKNNASPVPGTAFNKCTEYCVYGTRGTPFLSSLYQNLNEVQNKKCGTGNQLLEDISNIWTTKRLPSNQMEHPTSKNPELHHKFIMRCTKPNDIIFDSFSGSASTMICAEQLGRRVYATEIEPIFCDLAIRRYEKLTGKKAEVIRNYYEKA
jgi:DNA modification methylase